MRQTTTLFLIAAFLFFSFLSSAQTVTSKLVDKKTNEPIPFATIQLSEHTGVITNEEGRFSFTLDAELSKIDSIYISSMGYEKIALALSQTTDSIIYIIPKAIELKEVFLFKKNLSIEEIIANVKEKLPQNYNHGLTQKRLFFRESSTNFLNKLDINFKKSTIPELNKKFIDSVTGIIPKNSEYYTETLGDLYGNYDKQKLHIIKAAELYDKNNNGSMEHLSEKLEDIFKKNVKRNSYLKIKSGIFGQKVQLDSVLDEMDEAKEIEESLEKPKHNHLLDSRRSSIRGLLTNLFFQEDSKLNMLRKSNRYLFELVDYTTIDEEVVYIVDFVPKRRADFKGTLYINTDDFAVVRVDYENVKLLKRIKLLGISYEENVYRGKTIFSKDSNGKYSPRFIEKEVGNKVGVDRPLKVIEKNKYVKGKRKQNELSLGIDVINSSVEKYELVVFNSQGLAESKYSNTKENKTVTAQYLSQYNPEFWKGYDILEPNAVIRSFSVTDAEETNQ